MPGGTPEVSLRPVEPGDELFLDAEKLLSQNKPEEALSVYVRYSAQFPQGRHADNALRRIGTIYFQLGQLDEATGFFQRLLNEHPRSRYISEARLALIDIYMLKQQFPEAIQIGLQLLSEEKDPGEQRQIQMKLAKLYRAQGILSEAVKIEYALYQSAKDSEKSRWFDHLKASIAQLDLASLEYIWDSVTDSELRSYLMYRYAEVQASSGNFDDALDVITVFLQRYPGHR